MILKLCSGCGNVKGKGEFRWQNGKPAPYCTSCLVLVGKKLPFRVVLVELGEVGPPTLGMFTLADRVKLEYLKRRRSLIVVRAGGKVWEWGKFKAQGRDFTPPRGVPVKVLFKGSPWKVEDML